MTPDAVDPRSEAAQAALGRYFAELNARFPAGFDDAGRSAIDAELFSPPRGVFLLALNAGAPIACGGVHTIGDGVGEIKRMWVDVTARGAGLGSRLLRHLEEAGRSLGHTTVRLDTNEALTEAIAMYERAGYRRIERYNDNPYATHFFEKDLGI